MTGHVGPEYTGNTQSMFVCAQLLQQAAVSLRDQQTRQATTPVQTTHTGHNRGRTLDSGQGANNSREHCAGQPSSGSEFWRHRNTI